MRTTCAKLEKASKTGKPVRVKLGAEPTAPDSHYIGINEPPTEIFGKVTSVSDHLMWRYYEPLTALTVEQLAILGVRPKTANATHAT